MKKYIENLISNKPKLFKEVYYSLYKTISQLLELIDNEDVVSIMTFNFSLYWIREIDDNSDYYMKYVDTNEVKQIRLETNDLIPFDYSDFDDMDFGYFYGSSRLEDIDDHLQQHIVDIRINNKCK
jgi:hypothetical protein